VCKIGPERIIRKINNNYGTTTNFKFDMCQVRKRNISEEQENVKISSYTKIVSKRKKKKTTMEMFLPYTSH
jgi:hypothetical protein